MGNRYTWATAMEKNNQGFYVERRSAAEVDGFFEKIGFVQGKGNADVKTSYAYTDRNVTPGTYQYRLVQLDLDGAEKVSNTVEVGISDPRSYSLEQNFPNPFQPKDKTEIDFILPSAGETKLVVYNSIGQQVRVLIDGLQSAGSHRIFFDGKDDAGNELPTGTYLYKLSNGSFNANRKLTISK
jgi:hypothetical protein